MSKRAKEAALKAYPQGPDEFHMCVGIETIRWIERRIGFQEGYESAEKNIIDRLVEFYPTLDYTFRSYMVQVFPELKGKIEHYD